MTLNHTNFLVLFFIIRIKMTFMSFTHLNIENELGWEMLCCFFLIDIIFSICIMHDKHIITCSYSK